VSRTGARESGGTATGGTATGGAPTGGSGTCAGADKSGAANIDVSTEYRTISGYGGASLPGWIADLTSDQIDRAFGNGSGQMGLTILRIRIPYDESQFSQEVATPQRALSLGAKVMATPRRR
jgi:O-glycosyl hydrolase